MNNALSSPTPVCRLAVESHVAGALPQTLTSTEMMLQILGLP